MFISKSTAIFAIILVNLSNFKCEEDYQDDNDNNEDWKDENSEPVYSDFEEELTTERSNPQGEKRPAKWDVLSRIKRLEANFKFMDQTLQKLLDLSRLNSLLFYGVPDTGQEKFTARFEKLKRIFKAYYNFNLEPTIIDRLVRLGPSYGDEATPRDSPRPIFIRFSCVYYRSFIIYNAKYLKGSPYIVQPWLSPKHAEIKKELIEIMREINMNHPGAAKMKNYQNLLIRGVSYNIKALRKMRKSGSYDSLTNSTKPIQNGFNYQNSPYSEQQSVHQNGHCNHRSYE